MSSSETTTNFIIIEHVHTRSKVGQRTRTNKILASPVVLTLTTTPKFQFFRPARTKNNLKHCSTTSLNWRWRYPLSSMVEEHVPNYPYQSTAVEIDLSHKTTWPKKGYETVECILVPSWILLLFFIIMLSWGILGLLYCMMSMIKLEVFCSGQIIEIGGGKSDWIVVRHMCLLDWLIVHLFKR